MESAQGADILRRAGESDIHFSGLQQTQYLVAATGYDLDMHTRILSMKSVQIGQKKLAGHCVAGTDGQMSHLQLPGLGQLFLPGFQQPHSTSYILIKHFSIRSQGNAPRISGKQTRLKV